jgi:hypothetical protein
VAWIDKFLARIRALTTGRYCIILTIGSKSEDCDWTVLPLGKIERPRGSRIVGHRVHWNGIDESS